MNLVQGTPTELAQRVEISQDISRVVMDALSNPTVDSETQLLSNFTAACPVDDQQKARTAEKSYLAAPAAHSPQKKSKYHGASIALSLPIAIVCMIVGALLAAIFIIPLANTQKPVDLFAIPELVPMAATDGVDVVIAPRVIPPNTSAYITATDGTLMRLGGLPIIYRQQQQGTRLTFVIADDAGHSTQIPVTVNGHDGLMVIPVELNW